MGFGGTERGLVTLARAIDQERLQLVVIAVNEEGPLAEELRAGGVKVTCSEGDPDRLARALEGVDVAIVSRAGTREPMVPAACRAAGVGAVVEWSIFGSVDTSPDEAAFAAHLFISRMCWLRYRAAVSGGADFFDRHRVLYLPLDYETLQSVAPGRDRACEELGLDPARPVVSRIGRAADLKWRDMLADMVPVLLELVPEAQVVFVGATERKRRRLARLGVLDRCTLVEPSPDRRMLAAFLAASDVTINASTIGESQGLAIAESLALGVPVVTCSTPWVDNAQIEFVEHGVTGLVANHPTPFAEAVAGLLLNPERAKRLGEQGKRFVEAELDPAGLARQVEVLTEALEATGEMPAEWNPSAAECSAFAAEYRRRLGLSQRALSRQERREAAAARLRERLDRLRAVAGAVLPRPSAPAEAPEGRGKPPVPATLGPGSVSGCVVARNEEAVIDRCLSSLDGVVDELILVHDGPCEDRTLEIAAAHEAKVVVAEPLGNPEAHTVTAYDLARGEWLLNIDADEFLSDELRAAVPGLVRDDSVNGYQFFWPLWNGRRYTSTSGPYKLALSRRSATRLFGMLQAIEEVDPPVRRLDLHLEHRPLYNNFSVRSIRSKWDRWAAIQARELLGPYSAIPKFNWTGPERWPWYRPLLNLLSPLMVVVLPPLAFLRFVAANRRQLDLRENLRASALLAIYVGLVQYHVARGRYGG